MPAAPATERAEADAKRQRGRDVVPISRPGDRDEVAAWEAAGEQAPSMRLK